MAAREVRLAAAIAPFEDQPALWVLGKSEGQVIGHLQIALFGLQSGRCPSGRKESKVHVFQRAKLAELQQASRRRSISRSGARQVQGTARPKGGIAGGDIGRDIAQTAAVGQSGLPMPGISSEVRLSFDDVFVFFGDLSA